MTKKYEEKSMTRLLEIFGFSRDQIDELNVQGADETTIVYSGLDEIMSEAVH